MRRIATAVAAGLIVLAGLGVPAVGAATPTGPKVAIIVGPVGSMTASYKADADAAYNEARKYTSNVVRVYTPNATWAAAKAALQGASVVIYLGHGNGFPSPYRSTAWPYSQNGLGLNPKAGVDNSTTQYWGEYYLARDVHLAPNAVVLLHHLCYASGNSESGKPAPTPTMARQRVDNMAAGWLRAGARAVVAEGHFGPAWYVGQLFTTHKTIDRIWHDSPTFKNRAFSFASSRTAGATVEMDPDGTPNGYWRAVTGWLGTTTDQMTGASYASTDVDPTAVVAPGNATVRAAADGSGVGGVYPDATLTPDSGTMLPPSTIAGGTKLRVLEKGAEPTFDGSAAYRVGTFPDGDPIGWMSAADLVPRDSASPVVWSVDDGDGAFSPNGDGSGDLYKLSARLSESADWRVEFQDGDGTALASKTGSGSSVSASWTGLVDGAAVPDGTYRWRITAVDGWQNPVGSKGGTFRADTVAPAFVDAVAAAAADPSPVPTFSPNGDGTADTIALGFSTSEAGYVDVVVLDDAGHRVRSFATAVPKGPGRATWDGLNDAGAYLGNGSYAVRLTPRDYAGNVGSTRTESVGLYRTLRGVAVSSSLFYPQDLDAYARTTRFSFTLLYGATVRATVRDAAGTVILTKYDAAALAAGTYAFAWDGRGTDGTMAKPGRYTYAVSATDGTLGATGAVAVLADGFRITSSDATPGRRQRITIYATSAESLKASPRVRVYQAGLAGHTFTMTKSGSRYRVTITLKGTGGTGKIRFVVTGKDGAGRTNRATVSYPLH